MAIVAVFAVVIMGCPTPGGGGGNNDQTPKADDFEISGTGAWLYDGNAKTVTITPKSGKSKGRITVKYNDSTTPPSDIGTYTVTFDIDAAAGWIAAEGLDAGTLKIDNQTDAPETPTADDFIIGNLSQAVGKVTAVTITPKQGRSNGAVTIYYNGRVGLPTARGAYPVTFDVAEAYGWKPAAGLAAGTLTVNDVVISDISNLSKYLSNQKANTKTTPYHIAVNVKEDDFGSLLKTLNGAPNKYVNLNFSGDTITGIPDLAFNTGTPLYTGCPTLTGITIPDSVTSIGNNAFTKCTSLTSVTIPASVTSIGNDAFTGCAGLTSVTMPDGVTRIGERVFYECISLTSVNIPASVTSIEFGAFSGCASLASVTIPNSVTSIGGLAFHLCASLANVTIPYSVTSIGDGAFYLCTSLNSVTIIRDINSGNFSEKDAFPGDLRAKFYAINPTNGTPGIYKTANPGLNAVWVRQ